MTQTIASQVRRIRTEKKISAQQLSVLCAQLGLDMPRSILADLENGRRAGISVAELLVLARALDVPSLLLVFPVGAEAQVEVLPGQMRAPFRAAQWFAGERGFPGEDDEDYLREIAPDWNHATRNPLALFRSYDTARSGEARARHRARVLDEMAASAAGTVSDDFASEAAARRKDSDRYRAEAESLRGRARELGLVPPGSTGT